MRYPLLYPTDDETQTATLVVDRRSGKRHFLSNFRPIRLLPRPSFQSFHAFFRDFSIQGIGLIFTRSLEPGTLLALQLRKKKAGMSDILTAEVRHATPLDDGFWALGCQLPRPLTQEECLALLHEDAAEQAC
jgi:PilZ domain